MRVDDGGNGRHGTTSPRSGGVVELAPEVIDGLAGEEHKEEKEQRQRRCDEHHAVDDERFVATGDDS